MQKFNSIQCGQNAREMKIKQEWRVKQNQLFDDTEFNLENSEIKISMAHFKEEARNRDFILIKIRAMFIKQHIK